MNQLLEHINILLSKTKLDIPKNNENVFPFNYIEFTFCYLLEKNIISFDEYLEIRNDYISRNVYLHLYNLGPAAFGVSWAQPHISDLSDDITKPSKKLDPEFSSNYDLFHCRSKKRIEIKAGRLTARDNSKNTSISERAMTFDDAYNNKKEFWTNYQQIYFGMSDITILILVCTDVIKYLAFQSITLEENQFMKGFQHRGNKGEGQLWIDNDTFPSFYKLFMDKDQLLNYINSL
jgi:hypothetical protein